MISLDFCNWHDSVKFPVGARNELFGRFDLLLYLEENRLEGFSGCGCDGLA
jgi:hypothetical protein